MTPQVLKISCAGHVIGKYSLKFWERRRKPTGVHNRNLASDYLIGNKPDRQALNHISKKPKGRATTMEATINQSDFQKAISAVLGVVDKRGTMPILSNVLLKANGDGGIQVSATDLEVSYKGFCPARIETPGAITVPVQPQDFSG
jgi:hypothetical protein